MTTDPYIQFLKNEYRTTQRQLLTNADEKILLYIRGIKRGLEIALVHMGTTNEELDKICMDEYKNIRKEWSD